MFSSFLVQKLAEVVQIWCTEHWLCLKADGMNAPTNFSHPLWPMIKINQILHVVKVPFNYVKSILFALILTQVGCEVWPVARPGYLPRPWSAAESART